MLLNIDIPLRTATLHDEACPYVPKPHGTDFKPVERLGRDGGWFEVSTAAEAAAVARREHPTAVFRVCQRCQELQQG